MPLKHTNPPGLFASPTYSHVVEATGSKLIFFAGQVSVNADGEVVGEGDLAAQAIQVFENLQTCLTAAGATFADVTRLTTYIVNYGPEKRAFLAEARQRFLPAEPPASTLLGVQSLARPEYLIEIEATVVL